ncbi:MAG: NAD-dependent deacylase [Bacteroidota bacterium]|nr:NAD-dependent deacylase [Bacteroidota bacterium]MDP4204777.1 NAD-dependent deacylase [Bacteroidota bacterium]
MVDLIKKAAAALKESKFNVVFTGAGVSVESGIPPFRGATGLWSKYDPKVLDLDYFHDYPDDAWFYIREIFYDFFGKARPNEAHRVIARMEQEGLLKCVITQNIDNLHQEAGSKVVYEFHGNSQILVCPKCGNKIPVGKVDLKTIPPRCNHDGTVLKPDFIFFGEGIPEAAYLNSFEAARNAEVFMIIGTTGEVMPASIVPQEAKRRGALIIEINPEKSLYTNDITDIYLPGKAGEVMTEIEKYLF